MHEFLACWMADYVYWVGVWEGCCCLKEVGYGHCDAHNYRFTWDHYLQVLHGPRDCVITASKTPCSGDMPRQTGSTHTIPSEMLAENRPPATNMTYS
jgi:hypothetical protein